MLKAEKRNSIEIQRKITYPYEECKYISDFSFVPCIMTLGYSF